MRQRKRRAGWRPFILSTLMAAGGSLVAQESATNFPTTTVHTHTTPEQRREIADFTLGTGLQIGGLVEVELTVGEDDGESISELTLATVELGVNFTLNELVQSEVLLLWEEDDTEPIDLDVATIILRPRKNAPFSLTAGRLYLPFGVYESHFVSDPIVLELGETRQTACLLAYETAFIKMEAAAFDGDVDEEQQESRIEDFCASILCTPLPEATFGTYWVSDLGESDLLEEILIENVHVAGDDYDSVAGLGGYLSLQGRRWGFVAEIVSALRSYAPGKLADDSRRPRAWNLEMAWAISADFEFAVKYEESDELPTFPEQQYGACATFGLSDNSSFAIEYLQADYSGDGDRRNIATAQLAMEF